MSKRSELENDWTCWKWSFLDFQICQKDRCAATIEYHRPWGCHSCQSIPVLSKGTESVSYSCLGQIDERWRWTKENKVLKSNDERRTEKCQMLRQRDHCWGQRRVEMTWRYYFGTMPQNSHSTNKRSRILVALSIWGSSSIRWGRQSSTPWRSHCRNAVNFAYTTQFTPFRWSLTVAPAFIYPSTQPTLRPKGARG